MSNRSADESSPTTGLQKVCDMQMMHCKRDNEQETTAKSHFSLHMPRKCENCPHRRHESLSRRQTRGASLLPPGNLYRRRPHPRTLLHGPGLRAPGYPTKPLPAPLAASERTQGFQVRDYSEWHFLVAEQAQVISQPHKRIPKARITSRELHPSTRPLRARPLCGCRWPGRRVGEGRPAGEGARRDPRQPHRPGSGSSGRPEWLPMLSRLGQRPAGRTQTRCPPCGSSRRLRLARQLRPAVGSSQRKGPAPSNSRRPPAERLLVRAGGPRPLICIPPAHLEPHGPPARPARLICILLAHFIFTSLLSIQRVPPTHS